MRNAFTLMFTFCLTLCTLYLIRYLQCRPNLEVIGIKNGIHYAMRGHLHSEIGPHWRNEQIIYAITSTYSRLTQKADLTRLIQTLMHVPRFHWILIEDSIQKTALVTKLLQKSGLTFTHLNKKNTALKYTKDLQTRNTALNWIRDNVNNETDGVLYFMDDDNTYGLKLFQEMRKTKLASAWPVGLVGGLKYEGPVLCKNGRVVTWRVVWAPKRTIPIDMAGFAVSTALVRQFPKVVFVDKRELESLFLEGLGITRDTIEAQGNNCTEVNVWHTQTVKTKADLEKIATEKGTELNPLIEV